jgi:hypothetical protein
MFLWSGMKSCDGSRDVAKGKGWKARLLKSAAAAEAIYTIWKYRNDVCFGDQVHNTNIEDDIINTIVYRG